MDAVRTVVCQLTPTTEQAGEIRATLQAFAAACNAIADVARAEHTTNKVLIQRACYPAIRQQFGLSANLTIRAIARVCAALKVPAKAHSQFAPTAIDYDARIFRAHYPKVRRLLQAKCTKGARRALKRLSGREQRHMRAVNHVISRSLVDTAHATHRTLALEDLTGIRARTQVHKPQRYAQQSWAFAQLRHFLTYKAQDAGVAVRLVNPAYTSQTCHRCGVRGHRDGLTFSCDRCGSYDADWNAALNIASRGGPVTPPVRAGASTSSAKATGL